MGREKKSGHGATAPGTHAKDKHRKNGRDLNWTGPPPASLRARPDVPNARTKHHSYYELVENKEKKKKLEFQITTDRNPPPGFEFVPIGNPELTTACKEISRGQDAMIFIVAPQLQSHQSHRSAENKNFAQHINRIGHHIRQTIVEEARVAIGESDESSAEQPIDVPEPIPETQQEINEQADAAIRDLFPRIPNTDRQLIIEHAFKKGAKMKGEPLVGLARDITLSRRVQLAVLAHIRHTHTRYDRLLRETSRGNARKAVESLCLDILVKWRGDEETGRDQLDEILREVIVISDSEGESEDEDDSGGDESSDDSVQELAGPGGPQIRGIATTGTMAGGAREIGHANSQFYVVGTHRAGTTGTALQAFSKKVRSRFKRYDDQAARLAKWDEARKRLYEGGPSRHSRPIEMDGLVAPGPRQAAASYANTHGAPVPDHGFQNPPLQLESATASRSYVTRADRPVSANSNSMRSPYAIGSPVGHVPRANHQRVVSNGPILSNRPSPEPVRSRPGSTVFYRPEQLQDYLVPSIEPVSPGIERPTESIFVRTLPPASPPRPRDQVSSPFVLQAGYFPPPQHLPRQDDLVQRRGAADEQPGFIRLPSRQEPSPPMLVSERQRNSPPRAFPLDPTRFVHVRETVPYGSYQQPLAPAPRRQVVDAHGAVLREDRSRPVVVEEWARHSDRVIERPPPLRTERAALPIGGEIIGYRRHVQAHHREVDMHGAASSGAIPGTSRVVYDRRERVEYIPVIEAPPRGVETVPVRFSGGPSASRPISPTRQTPIQLMDIDGPAFGSELAPHPSRGPMLVDHASHSSLSVSRERARPTPYGPTAQTHASAVQESANGPYRLPNPGQSQPPIEQYPSHRNGPQLHWQQHGTQPYR